MLPKLKLFFFVFLLLAICAATVIWMYYGDRGTLTLEGDLPDSIQGVVLGDQRCNSIPCSLIVRPGEYLLTFEKKDFYSLSIPVRIYLFDETNVQLQFKLKPKLSAVGETVHFSVPLSRVTPTYADNQLRVDLPARRLLENFPIPEEFQKIDQLWFSPAGNNLILSAEGKIVWLQPNLPPVTLPLSTGDAPFQWDGETTLFFWKTETPGTVKLMEFGLTNQRPSTISTLYGLQEPSLAAGSANLYVWDKNGSVFQVERTSGRKETLLTNEDIQTLTLSPTDKKMLLRDSFSKFNEYDLTTKKKKELDLPQITAVPPIYLSDDTLLITGIRENTLYLQTLDTTTGKLKEILQQTVMPEETLAEIGRVGKDLYIVLGKTLYQVTGSY